MQLSGRQVKDEIVPHHEVSELNLLLCGRHPDIYSARNAPVKPIFAPTEVSAIPNPRFSPVPSRPIDETPPGQIPRTARPNYANNRSLYKQSKLLSQVKEDQTFTESLSNKITAYDSAARMKTSVLAKDYEDHYYIPLQYRIKDKMTPKGYKLYQNKKQKLINYMDQHQVPIRSPRKLPAVPHITYSTEGLRDPTYKYIEHQKQEEELEKVVLEANGEKIIPKQKPPVNTLDYKMFSVQYQTRFFFGNDPQGNKTGRKVYAGTGASRVGNVLDEF